MEDQKHFKYEAKDVVVPDSKDEVEEKTETEIEVLGVSFLTPAILDVKGRASKKIQVSIDLVNRLVYEGNSVNKALSEATFQHLDDVNTLPEDFFQAGEDIYDKAEEALTEHDRIKEEQVGGN